MRPYFTVLLRRWIYKIGLLLAAVTLIAVSSVLRSVAEINFETQDTYIAGISYGWGGVGSDQITSPDVVKLVRNGFFRVEQTEPVTVRMLKQNLSSDLSNLYFTSAWDLFWYLKFIGDTDSLFNALVFSLENGVFKSSENCVSYLECETLSESANVNSDNAKKLFAFIRDHYIESALKAFARLSYEEGYRFAGDALTLIRLVDMRPNIGGREIKLYNDVIVVSSFLTRPSIESTQSFRLSDYEILRAFIEREMREPPAPFDSEIRMYIDGLRLFRDDCFMEASQFFSKHAEGMQQEPVGELLAFMALRSLARPFIDRDKLFYNDDDRSTPWVQDCGGELPYTSFLFEFLRKKTKSVGSAIRHPGLITDLEFYEAQFPGGASTRVQQGPMREVSRVEEFIWPTNGEVALPFESGVNEHIVIAVDEGEEVLAVGDGQVSFVENQFQSKGGLVLIDHGHGYVAAYGYLKEVHVRTGQYVQMGELIGDAGHPVGASSGLVFFHISKESAALDPEIVLTQPSAERPRPTASNPAD